MALFAIQIFIWAGYIKQRSNDIRGPLSDDIIGPLSGVVSHCCSLTLKWTRILWWSIQTILNIVDLPEVYTVALWLVCWSFLFEREGEGIISAAIVLFVFS